MVKKAARERYMIVIDRLQESFLLADAMGYRMSA